MKIIALFFTVLTGFSVASISIIVSQVAKDKISFFQFFAISNLLASVTAWLLFPNWALVSDVDWGKVLLITGSVGIVNTTLQAATVCSLKWGHNGLSVAIRNTSSMISMLFALIVLNEKISIINFCGVILVIISLGVVAFFSRKDSISKDLKKWIPAVLGSLLLSGAYQILMTSTVILPDTTLKAGVIIPCLMGASCLCNLIASQIERKFCHQEQRCFHFEKRVWLLLGFWVGVALLQYFLMVKALTFMKEAEMASLTWPMLIGLNVTIFSIFCRLKWKEKYPHVTIIGLVGCVLGIIMMIIGRK